LGLVVAVIVLSLLPNAPFASNTVPWQAALPPTVKRVVPPGSVVLTVPFAAPESAQAMTWEAIDDMDFKIIGGYANIVDPGKPYGQRQPPALPPAHVQKLLSLPKLGTLLPYVSPTAAQAQLLTYLTRYSVGAIVFSAGGANTSLAYWYLIDTLGQPQVVRQGFAIWLPTGGHWPAHPLG
jgi:hypothetical protein